MALVLTCPGCQTDLRLPESVSGKTIRCPHCEHRIKVLCEPEPGFEDKFEVVNDDEEPEAEGGFEVVEQPICPYCRCTLNPEAVICIQCGYDLRTRKRLTTAFRGMDVVETVGSKTLGTYTDYIFRRDAEGWVLIVDSWTAFMHMGYKRMVLRDYKEVRTAYFRTGRYTERTTVTLIDHRGGRHHIKPGGSQPVKFLLDNLQRAGLTICPE